MTPAMKNLKALIAQQAMEALLNGEAKEYLDGAEVNADEFPKLYELLTATER